LRQRPGPVRVVLAAHSDQRQQPAADLTHDRAVHRYSRCTDPADHRAHQDILRSGRIGGVPTLRLPQDAAADELLGRDPLALLLWMLLDQHLRRRSS
jgi:hypothetical protein